MNYRETVAIGDAQDAFWETLKEGYPEITRDDLSEVIEEFNKATEKAALNWISKNQRIFSAVYPTGIIWSDRYRESHGDYKRLAFLSFGTLKLKVEKDCPKDLGKRISLEANKIQNMKGLEYEISSCGQKIILGFDMKD